MVRVVSDDARGVAAPPSTTAEPRARSLPAFALALLLIVVAAPVFWRALVELAARWDEPGGGNSHGYVVAALVPWLAWLQRDRVYASAGGRRRAMAAGVALGVLYAAARAAHVELMAWSLVPPILFAALIAAHGWRGGRSLAAPVAYLYFALPVWAVLTPVLQSATVLATSALLRVAGVPAFIDGDFVTVPAGTFEIAGGCAGTSFLVVALATAALFAFVERLPRRSTLSLFGAAATMAVVLNWIRVTTIIVVGNATAMQTALVDDHYALGWWLFAAGLVPLFLYARRIAVATPAARRGAAPAVPTATAIARAAPALAVLVFGPSWTAFAVDRIGAAPVLSAPEVRGWALQPSSGAWRPAFPGAAATLAVTYRSGPGSVDAFAAYYGLQRPNAKLVGHPSDLGGEGWAYEPSAHASGDARRDVVRGTLVAPDGRRRAVWSWYEVRGKRVLSPAVVKWREAAGVLGLAPRSGVVALAADCRPDCDAAHASIAAAYDAGLGTLSAGTAGR
jgi:EpsI family protein